MLGIPPFGRWCIPDQLVVPLPGLTRQAIDAMARQPDKMDVRCSEEDNTKQPQRPDSPGTGGKRQGDGKEHDDFDDTLPLRLMRFEVPEQDVANSEDAEYHGGIEPEGCCTPHENVACRECRPPQSGVSKGRACAPNHQQGCQRNALDDVEPEGVRTRRRGPGAGAQAGERRNRVRVHQRRRKASMAPGRLHALVGPSRCTPSASGFWNRTTFACGCSILHP
jgi:hypothetical protein